MTDQNSSPLVSVILPTHNRARQLARALKSVLSQTYSRLEVIVVDDGSSDATPEAVQSFRDPRIQYIRQEVARGPGGARNEGIKFAQGEIFSFLDDDDEYFGDKLRLQVRAMGESLASVGFVYSPVQTMRDGQSINLFPAFEESGNIFLQYLSGFSFPITATLIRRQFMVPFDQKLTCLEDVDFHLKILKSVNAVFAPGVCATCHFDSNGKRVSENLASLHQSFRVLERRYFYDPKDSFLARAHADLLLRFAFRLFALGYNDEAARGYIDRAFLARKDGRRLFFKLLNNLAPGMLRLFRPRFGS